VRSLRLTGGQELSTILDGSVKLAHDGSSMWSNRPLYGRLTRPARLAAGENPVRLIRVAALEDQQEALP
jgi:hypothetical protein